MKKYYINKKEVDGKKFKYFDIGSETHGRTTYRVWVNNRIPLQKDGDGNEYVEFPLVGAEIKEGKKGNTLILKPSKDKIVADYFVKCGYRGSSNFEIIKGYCKEYPYYVYSSETGSLGVSKGALLVFNKQDKLHISWSKSGRLYGSPGEGECLLSVNGEECVVGDLDELINELE